jgi:peptidoglycan/xylan/chitin deacetylase (PgdA/CDA1 family)
VNRTKYLLAVGLAEATAAVRRTNAALFGTRTLMYHDLGDGASTTDIYLLSPTSFRAQIEAISQWADNQQIPFVPLTAEPQPGIAITFDDGYRSTLAIAAPLLAQHGIPFHIFATRAHCQSGDARYLNETDLRELAALPDVVISAHGTTHTRLAHMPPDVLHRELLDAKDWLQQVIQRPVNSLSYPHGSFTPATTEAVQRCGYSYACSSQPGTFRSIEQRFSIPRIDIWSHDSVRTALHKLRGVWDWML